MRDLRPAPRVARSANAQRAAKPPDVSVSYLREPTAPEEHVVAVLDAERRLGRKLTLGERNVDIVGLDRDLAIGKARLHEAIEKEKRRALRSHFRRGATVKLNATPEMLAALRWLYEQGRRHGANEIENLTGERFKGGASEKDTIDRLLVKLTGHLRELQTKIEHKLGKLTGERLALSEEPVIPVREFAATLGGLGDVSQQAAEQQVMQIPGALNVSSQMVSDATYSGVGSVYDEAAGLFQTWVYSAVMDDGTCDTCAAADGDEYDSWDAIQDVLPDGGPNPDCDGEGRCRCRAVPGEAAATATGEPSPDGGASGEAADVPAPGAVASDYYPGPPVDRQEAVAEQQDYRIDRWASDIDMTPAEMREYMDRRVAGAVRDADVQMRIRPDAFQSVINEGRFKSQFETQTSGGRLDPSFRAEAERNIFGYPRDLPAEQRPIYAYLSGAKETDWLSMYGDMIVRLKADVRARTTFTLDDSLGRGGFDFLAEPLTAPSSRAYDWMVQPPSVDADVSVADLSRAYPEAQIHGGVTLADIEEVVIPEWTPPYYWKQEHERYTALRKLVVETAPPGGPRVGALETIDERLAEAETHLADPYTAIERRLDELGIRYRHSNAHLGG